MKLNLAAFVVVGSVFALVSYSEELHITKYLPYLVIAGVLIHMVIFNLYRKKIVDERKKEIEALKKRQSQPWE